VNPGNGAPDVADLLALARDDSLPSPRWTLQSDDLNANLLVFARDRGVADHVNTEVDVLVVGVYGEGIVTIDGRRHALHAGQALLIPKGARRSTTSTSGRFAYLTCHQRRRPLMPRVSSRGGEE